MTKANTMARLANPPAFRYVNFTLTSSGMQGGTLVENNGNCFTIGSGATYSKFTAPISGLYYFGFSVLITENTGRLEIDIRKNGNSTIDGFASNSANDWGGGYSTSVNDFVFRLNAGDYVDLSLILGTYYSGAARGDRQFYGYLIG